MRSSIKASRYGRAMRWVVSVKAAVLDEDARVLLGLNDRGEWELPGGQLEHGESPQRAVEREVLGETRLQVSGETLLRAWVFEPPPAPRC